MKLDRLKTLQGATDVTTLTDKALVKELQHVLNRLGFNAGAEDGIPGQNTAEALKRFKEKSYLEHPYLLGQSTVTALLEAVNPHPVIRETPEVKPLAKVGYLLPGISKAIQATDKIYQGSAFTWSEATKGMTRLPKNDKETANIVKMARYMDKVRAYLGNRPITVTSWHRPEPINTQVGGASGSYHVPGLAVDFVVAGQTPRQTQKLLDHWHGANGGLGYGRTFTHIDLRGYRARFNYGK